RLMTLDPGHFHASLVQKSMYDQISPTVYVYSKEGSELDAFLAAIESYNNRDDDPTNWEMEENTAADFLQKMIQDKKGNVMMTAGFQRDKPKNINAPGDAPVHVLRDELMAIHSAGF